MTLTSRDTIEVIWWRHPQVWIIIALACISGIAGAWSLATKSALVSDLQESRRDLRETRQQLADALKDTARAASEHSKDIASRADAVRVRHQRISQLESEAAAAKASSRESALLAENESTARKKLESELRVERARAQAADQRARIEATQRQEAQRRAAEERATAERASAQMQETNRRASEVRAAAESATAERKALEATRIKQLQELKISSGMTLYVSNLTALREPNKEALVATLTFRNTSSERISLALDGRSFCANMRVTDGAGGLCEACANGEYLTTLPVISRQAMINFDRPTVLAPKSTVQHVVYFHAGRCRSPIRQTRGLSMSGSLLVDEGRGLQVVPITFSGSLQIE